MRRTAARRCFSDRAAIGPSHEALWPWHFGCHSTGLDEALGVPYRHRRISPCSKRRDLRRVLGLQGGVRTPRRNLCLRGHHTTHVAKEVLVSRWSASVARRD